MEENPFPDLKISNSDFLDELEGRQKCPKCQKSRKFYCYSCYIPLQGTEGKIPRIQLPVDIDIIKHIQEVDGKSTSGHAALVAPDQVSVYTYPDIPEYKDKSKVILVFPGPDALTLEDYLRMFSEPVLPQSELDEDYDPLAIKNDEKLVTSQAPKHRKLSSVDEQSSATNFSAQNYDCDNNSAATCPVIEATCINDSAPGDCSEKLHCGCTKYKKTFDKVVFIDSTWHQVTKIRNDERLQCLQKVEIKTHTTKFWRHQRNKPDSYLSTIEAIYYFLREYHDLFETTPYTGQYDNLLFFFTFMYRKIRFEFERGKVLKAYDKPKASDKPQKSC